MIGSSYCSIPGSSGMSYRRNSEGNGDDQRTAERMASRAHPTDAKNSRSVTDANHCIEELPHDIFFPHGIFSTGPPASLSLLSSGLDVRQCVRRINDLRAKGSPVITLLLSCSCADDLTFVKLDRGQQTVSTEAEQVAQRGIIAINKYSKNME